MTVNKKNINFAFIKSMRAITTKRDLEIDFKYYNNQYPNKFL